MGIILTTHDRREILVSCWVGQFDRTAQTCNGNRKWITKEIFLWTCRGFWRNKKAFRGKIRFWFKERVGCCCERYLYLNEKISLGNYSYHNTVFLWKRCFFVFWRPPEQAGGFWLQRTGLIHIVLLMKISICYFDAAGICSKSFMNKGKTNVT